VQIGKRWTSKQAKFIGKIILSNFLELSLDKFGKYIETVEKSPCFVKLVAGDIVTVENLCKTEVFRPQNIQSNNLIVEIANDKESFSVRYFREGFTKRYIVNKEKLLALNNNSTDEENYETHLLLCKLRHITTRNEFTHWIFNGIITLQKNYFITGNAFELKHLIQRDLSAWISSFSPLKIDEGWISRIVKGKLVITPQGKELPLKFFFHKRKEKKKMFVKKILDQERLNLKSREIVKPYSDAKLRDKLKFTYGISVSKRSIGFYRRELGIPTFYKRACNYTYPPFGENFSVPYPLTFSSVNTHAAENSGVYELSLANNEIEYENDKTGVFYIGSSQNIKKRLKEHLQANGKNGDIRKIIKYNKCLFRYVRFCKDWQKEEKRLYKLFLATFGESPKCNKVSP